MTHYLTRVQTWFCDSPGCNMSFEGHGLAHDIWAEARQAGWTAVAGMHGCPDHPIKAAR